MSVTGEKALRAQRLALKVRSIVGRLLQGVLKRRDFSANIRGRLAGLWVCGRPLEFCANAGLIGPPILCRSRQEANFMLQRSVVTHETGTAREGSLGLWGGDAVRAT